MNTFKAGDKVEYVAYHDGRAAGTKATVSTGNGYDDLITVKDEFGNFTSAYARRFKLVEEKPVYKFKKGDKVRYDSGDLNPDFDGLELEIDCEREPEGSYVFVTKTNHYPSWKVGKRLSVTTKYLTLIEEPTLGGFKIGDKVRYTLNLWKGLEGTVHAFHGEYVEVMVTKLPDEPRTYCDVVVGKTLNQTVGGKGVSPFSLEKIEEEKPFTYADIQVGDKVRRTYTFEDGAILTKEGVVATKSGDYARAAVATLAHKGDDSSEVVTLELLERPEPVKAPEPWDNAKTGDVLFRVDKYAKERDTFVRKLDGGWTIFYPNGGTYQIGKEEKLSSYFLGCECIAPQLV